MATFFYKRRLSCTYHLLALLFCTAPFTVSAQIPSIEDDTKEYRANWGLAAINADAAYKIGITGQGIKVGILDFGVALAHPEFNQSARLTGLTVALPGYLHLLLPELYPSNIDAVSHGDISLTDNHGTHVGGIIAASKNAMGMHGVAYDSQLISANSAFRDPLSPKQDDELSELVKKQIDELDEKNGPDDDLTNAPAIMIASKADKFIKQRLL